MGRKMTVAAAVATEWVDLLSDWQLLDSTAEGKREVQKRIENRAFSGCGSLHHKRVRRSIN